MQMRVRGLFVFLLMSVSLGQFCQADAKQKENQKSCRLYEDSHQLMHFETSDSNFYWCFGYLHGRDRAWQMDFLRRSFQGRKAEIHGYTAIKQDVLMRMLGLPRHATRIYSEMSSDQKRVWDTYARGVNAGMQEALLNGVWEFKKLNYQPEEWLPEHSISMLLLQAFDQTNKTFRQEIKEHQWMQLYPAQASQLTSVADIPWDTTILKKGEYSTSSSTQALNAFSPKSSDSNFEEGLGGSNSWIVSRARSMTGNAWLANDPHLLLRDPPFWYWIHGTSPEHDVAGVSLPGVPVVVSGANRKISWGLTNSYIDVGDVFFIREHEAEILSERPVVWFRFWKFQIPFFFKSIQRTPQGYPVLPLDHVPSGKLAVLRWTGHELKAGDLASLPEIMKTSSAQEFDQKLSTIGLPSWNYIFLDSKGNLKTLVIVILRAFCQTCLFVHFK